MKGQRPWAAKGFPMAEEQILLKEATDRPSIREVAAGAGKLDGFVLDKDTKRIFIKGGLTLKPYLIRKPEVSTV